MNLIILSSVPNIVIVMIILESIAIMFVGGFIVFDMIKGKKKEKISLENNRKFSRRWRFKRRR